MELLTHNINRFLSISLFFSFIVLQLSVEKIRLLIICCNGRRNIYKCLCTINIYMVSLRKIIYLLGSHSPVFLLRCWPFGHLGFFWVLFEGGDDIFLVLFLHFLTPSTRMDE